MDICENKLMKILITTSSFNAKLPSLFDAVYNPYGRRLSEDEVRSLIEQYQPVGMIAGVEPITREVLRKATNLRIISRCGVGTDNVDLEAAKDFGIKVTTTPNAPTVSVAELTLALMLCLSRRLINNDMNVRLGKWKGPNGNLISGKTVGIIGCGRIGSCVAEMALAFGCHVIGYDPIIKVHKACTMTSLCELLSCSDIVTLHIPYNQENYHFINRERLAAMKHSSLLINTARGGLIDEDALFEALTNCSISGAAIDCFENEPYNGPLTTLNNIILSPHMGSSAYEGRLKMEQEAIDNLLNEALYC